MYGGGRRGDYDAFDGGLFGGGAEGVECTVDGIGDDDVGIIGE